MVYLDIFGCFRTLWVIIYRLAVPVWVNLTNVKVLKSVCPFDPYEAGKSIYDAWYVSGALLCYFAAVAIIWSVVGMLLWVLVYHVQIHLRSHRLEEELKANMEYIGSFPSQEQSAVLQAFCEHKGYRCRKWDLAMEKEETEDL